jgi:hypothetical protein
MLITPVAAFCDASHAFQWAQANASRMREKAHRRQHAERKKKFKRNDLPHQKRLTQAAFNKMIRLLDKDQGCISCNKGPDWQGQWHAGHYLTTAAYPSLRYDARNCHKQCSPCNAHLSGNIGQYSIGLARRYPGLYAWLRGSHEPIKFTCLELISMRKLYAAETRRLESGQPASRDWRALQK